MLRFIAGIFLMPVIFMVGTYFLFSCAARYGPSNDWRGLFHSRRFWGGLTLLLVATAMVFSLL